MRADPRSRAHLVPLAAACLVGAIVASAEAVTIDGTVDPAPVSTQVVQTSFRDTPPDYTPFDPMNQSLGVGTPVRRTSWGRLKLSYR